MNGPFGLSAPQIDALAAMRRMLERDQWALIGATAIRCWVPLPRPTADVDFAICGLGADIAARLRLAGWQSDPKRLQTWRLGASRIDIVPATEAELIAGVASLEDGFELSVVGFDLAFATAREVTIDQELRVRVPPLHVLVLLKMISWLDRPTEREKDLDDIVFMFDSALAVDDPRRWDASDPIGAANLDFQDAAAFSVGVTLGRTASLTHLHWAKRFVDVMRDDDSAEFAQLLRASRYVGDDREKELIGRLRAFEEGLRIGSTPAPQPALQPHAAPFAGPRITRTPFAWGSSGSFEMVLHDAIDAARLVEFSYDGRTRTVEPHVLGTKDGSVHLLGWQLAPEVGWRRFSVGKMSTVTILAEKFSGARRAYGRRSSFDRQIAVVRG